MINKPKNIAKNSQLLKGVGASSWFAISLENKKYRIKRYSEEGELECSRLFTSSPEGFEINTEYEFTYLIVYMQKTFLTQKELNMNILFAQIMMKQ